MGFVISFENREKCSPPERCHYHSFHGRKKVLRASDSSRSRFYQTTFSSHRKPNMHVYVLIDLSDVLVLGGIDVKYYVLFSNSLYLKSWNKLSCLWGRSKNIWNASKIVHDRLRG